MTLRYKLVTLRTIQQLKYLLFFFFYKRIEIESLKDNTPQNLNLVMKPTVLNGH